VSEKTLSAFVQRAVEALDEYDRLRAGGMSHGEALLVSGLYDAIVRPDVRADRDHRALAARNDD